MRPDQANNSGPSPIVSGSVQVGGNLLSTMFNRAFAKKDYKRQRKDALADWHMQNAYNSPQQQMQRLKEAGLNPNLVYGTGAVANNAQAPRASTIAPSRADLNIDPQSEVLKYANVQQTRLQSDNLQKQGELLDKEKMLKEAQILSLNKRTDRTIFDLDKDRYLRENGALDYQLDTMGARLHNIEMNTRFKIDENQRQELMNAKNLEYVTNRIGQIKIQNTVVPLQKKLIEENIQKLNQQFNQQAIKGPLQTQALRLINENQTYKNMLDGRTLGSQEDKIKAEADIKQLESNLIKSGLSKTFATDIIKLIFSNLK